MGLRHGSRVLLSLSRLLPGGSSSSEIARDPVEHTWHTAAVSLVRLLLVNLTPQPTFCISITMPKQWRPLWEALYVAGSIPPEGFRDHTGKTGNLQIAGRTDHDSLTLVPANETTFLSWLRFSMSLSSTGVIIAQMSQVQRAVHPDRERQWKYYILGVPQGCICQGVAILFVVIGALRFFRSEQALLRGRARTNGWDLWLAVCLLFVVGIRHLQISHSAHCCRFLVDFSGFSSSRTSLTLLTTFDYAHVRRGAAMTVRLMRSSQDGRWVRHRVDRRSACYW